MPVPLFRALMLAPGTAAPDVSLTVPVTVAVAACPGNRGGFRVSRKAIAAIARVRMERRVVCTSGCSFQGEAFLPENRKAISGRKFSRAPIQTHPIVFAGDR